jgi:hypothetical protein
VFVFERLAEQASASTAAAARMDQVDFSRLFHETARACG